MIYGLTDEQAGRAPTPSTLIVGTLVKHVTGGQRAWTWLPQDTVADVLAAYDEVCRAAG